MKIQIHVDLFGIFLEIDAQCGRTNFPLWFKLVKEF